MITGRVLSMAYLLGKQKLHTEALLILIKEMSVEELTEVMQYQTHGTFIKA